MAETVNGKPCIHGHGTLRYKDKKATCVECVRLANARKRNTEEKRKKDNLRLLEKYRNSPNKEELLQKMRDYGKYKRNKSRKNSVRREKYQKDESERLKIKNGYLKSRYGITLEEFNSLFFSQNKRCKICNSTVSKGKGWTVDHCHKSGNVRGILCGPCNSGLGLFNDNVGRLRKAITYLLETQ